MRIPAAALGAVALTVVVLGWLENPGHITANEAVTAAESAFAASGVHGVDVDDRPTAGVFAAKGGKRVPVWKTSATLKAGTVELWFARSDGEAVFLDDRAPDGGSQILTSAEFKALGAHYENPAVPRQVRRNIVLTGAALLVALVAAWLAVAAPALVPARSFERARSAPAPIARPGRARPLRATKETL